MTTKKTTIDSQLALRGARLIGEGGDQRMARERADVSNLLATRYEAWDRLRSHLFNPKDYPRLIASEAVRTLAHGMVERGWIQSVRRDGSEWVMDQADLDTEKYLRGGWLEEYAWLAYMEAGCDEAYFGQQIEWTVDGVVGLNEIDVIARRGSQLSFTSCKCVKPRNQTLNEKLRGHLQEVAYWDWHFADRDARGLLVTTADMLDELQRNVPRYPALLARAKVLEIGVAGLEQLGWPQLVQVMREHWNE